MLLLGAGESGKSTIIKQMKLIHEGSYNQLERQSYKEIIISNTIQSMVAILQAMESLSIDFKPKNPDDLINLNLYAQALNSLPRPYSQLNSTHQNHSNLLLAIKTLWNDSGVRECLQRSREFQLNDSALYYFESIDRISQPNYQPNDQDILRSRVKTTGITETVFVIGELKYKVFDVGGQRSERRKWIHCFENVTAILFLVALSEYDQVLYEDETTNRMEEAITLFDSICNSRWFSRTPMILFLNKIDIFQKKVLISPIENFFQEFQPPIEALNDSSNQNKIDTLIRAGTDFFSEKFVGLNKSAAKQIYVHLTCATDTSQIRFVLSAVNDIIIQMNLRECGLL
ncbi:hypothetical protein O181_086538 [Austropuccinia psidii MF-1]|uniref:G protein alpha subunit n=1 Tax=Austropuccinia psidii MF-1 TaxID=1389203 RepID=A0A9Q3FZF7_9BASI|nr:hypothetical protein [Austropuccinia psidii MF-1]